MIAGVDRLVQMRKKGTRPASLVLHVGDWDGGMASSWADWEPARGYLHARPATPLSGADLRCCVGMPVFVSGDPGLWGLAVAYGRLCVECGAESVLVLATDGADMLRIADSRKGTL